MTAIAAIDHADLTRDIERLRVGVGASDLHGSVIGFLCAGGELDNPWLGALQLEAAAAVDDDTSLVALLAWSRAGLSDTGGPAFEPLMPAADAPLAARAQALIDWCRGFLGGLGLAGCGDPAAMSDVAADIVRDFGGIAAMRYSADNPADDAAALAALRDFVCDGVLLLHAELRTPTRHGRASPA